MLEKVDFSVTDVIKRLFVKAILGGLWPAQYCQFLNIANRTIMKPAGAVGLEHLNSQAPRRLRNAGSRGLAFQGAV